MPDPPAPGGPLPPRWWWTGLTERERRGEAEPDWASFTRHALAHAPASPLPPERIPGDLSALAVPLRPFVTAAADRLTEAVTPLVGPAALDLVAFLRCFTDRLGTRLGGTAARTLVLELNVARVRGRLTGATGRDRFAEFLAGTATATGLAALLTEYPVLARLLAQNCRQAVDSAVELVTRLAADRRSIVATLLDGTDPGRLCQVEFGAGDAHRDGRAVALLHFQSGAAVVYKPRSVAMLAHVADLVGWLGSVAPTLGLSAVPALPRADYGWSRFVAHLPCADSAGIDRFYRRQGALLALLHATDGTDVHFENVVAHADQPALVDAETLFHPALTPDAVTGADPAMAALASSVARTGLLPTMLLGEHGAVDVSGLGGGEGAVYPLDRVAWADVGTDTMHLVRQRVDLPAGVNRPRLHGVEADPLDHQAALLAGFRAAYAAIAAHREEFCDLLRLFAEDEARIVVRPTAVYAALLDESTHPDLLREAQVRDRLLGQLDDQPAGELAGVLLAHERAALWAGDVPMFTTRPASRDVWAAGGERVADALAVSGLAAATAKVEGLGEADRRDQEWVIAAAFASRAGTVDHRGAGPGAGPGPARVAAFDPRRAVDLAVMVGEQIVGSARRGGDRVSWLGLEPIDGKYWHALPMGAGLADGYCGVALFLAQLGAVTGVERYAEIARAAVSPLPRLLDALAADPASTRAVGPGGFHGLGGICYALARLGTLLRDRTLWTWMDDAVRLVGLADDESGDADRDCVATGRAGGVAALVAVHAETGSVPAARLARTLADRVRDAAPPAVDGEGFLWGRGGTDWALRRAARRGLTTPPPDDGRVPARHRSGGLPSWGWCGGLAGLAVAESAVWPRHRDGLPPWLAGWLERLAGTAPLTDSSLCHGEFGILEALAVLGAHDERARSVYRRRATAVVDAVAGTGPTCGTPQGVPSPGLLTGLSGIGYGLLRLGRATQVPSVLLLEESAPAVR